MPVMGQLPSAAQPIDQENRSATRLWTAFWTSEQWEEVRAIRLKRMVTVFGRTRYNLFGLLPRNVWVFHTLVWQNTHGKLNVHDLSSTHGSWGDSRLHVFSTRFQRQTNISQILLCCRRGSSPEASTLLIDQTKYSLLRKNSAPSEWNVIGTHPYCMGQSDFWNLGGQQKYHHKLKICILENGFVAVNE